MVKYLLRPFSYLEITHPSENFSLVNWRYPILASAFFTITLMLSPFDINIWGEDGVVWKLLQLIQTLPGFYIAALTAVATFGNQTMDILMPGVPPTKAIIIGGKATETKLTRRLFLSSMFSYLAVLSITLTIVIIILTSAATGIKLATPEALHYSLKIAGIFPVFLFLSQLITITLWGLYYLGEKMHIQD